MQLRGVDTNLVIALGALLRERNVTRAARSLGLGQSSVSHALARLRTHFGDPLLVQVGRSMVLTERAKALVDPVSRAVSELERVFLHRDHFDPPTSERVFRLVASDNLAFYLLPKLAGIVAKEAPRVLLRVHSLNKDWPTALLAGDIDLKLGRTYKLSAGLRSQDLFEERFACVVGRHHPLEKRRITTADYARLRHLVVSPTASHADDIATQVDTLLAAQGRRRTVALTIPHFVVAPFIVAATDLSLTASERLIEPFVRLLKLRRFQVPLSLPKYRLSQTWAERADTDPAHAWLRGAVARAAGLSIGQAEIDSIDGSHGDNP